MKDKYIYYKVIQENYEGKWDDVYFHETNSRFDFTFHDLFNLHKDNFRAALDNSPGRVRVVNRRELREKMTRRGK